MIPAMNETLPYTGLKVVDLSQGVAGPYCAMMLAQYGADVIKVEPPYGDWIRKLGRRYGDHSAAGLANNRGKRSLALDLKSAAGQATVRRLAGVADIFVESFRPGITEAMGLGYAALRTASPDLLYVSVSGFGQTGPNAARPCTDGVAQSFTGLADVNRGNDGQPHRVPFLIVDQVTGLYAFQAVQAALFGRRDGAGGRHLDISLMQSAAAIQSIRLVEAALEGGTPEPLNVPTGSYRTRDGWITVALVKETQWQALARLIGRPDLADDPAYDSTGKRAGHADELIPMVAAAMATRDTADWQAALAAENILCERIASYTDYLADPHVRAVRAAPEIEQAGVGAVRAIQMPGTPAVDADDPRQQVPDTGADGRAVLAEWGFTAAEIAQLANDKILHERTA